MYNSKHTLTTHREEAILSTATGTGEATEQKRGERSEARKRKVRGCKGDGSDEQQRARR